MILHTNVLHKTMTYLGRVVLDLLLPPRCLVCGEDVEGPSGMCGPCWMELTFISAPYCSCCGFPFEFDVEDDDLCGACAQETPLFGNARAALLYDDASKRLLMKFKHSDGTHLAPALALWMERAGQDVLEDADVLVPVPLHWTRLLSRRYNQAALLARELSHLTKIPFLPHTLQRRHRTKSQGHLSVTGRHENVKSAFKIPLKYMTNLKGKRVVLIDDVMTSGATVNACVTACLKAGAARVDVLVTALVLR